MLEYYYQNQFTIGSEYNEGKRIGIKGNTMSEDVRVLEITNCRECPHLDSRWSNPPWRCEEGFLDIFKRHMDRVPKDCPLLKKKEYLDENVKPV